jgi:diguanylate cyclase (GGDEF)-like protein/PAS domain S-box-containing protein
MRAFTLTRYFSVLSFVLMVLAGTVLGALVRQQEIHQMETVAQNRNVDTTQLLRNVLVDDIADLIHPPIASSTSMSDQNLLLGKLGAKISPLIHDSGIYKLKLYNLQGITLFSTDPTQIGEDKSSNAGYVAAQHGKVASELTRRDQISPFDSVANTIDLVSSYVPIFEKGQVVAVFEVYQDVTSLMKNIGATLWQVGLLILAVLGTLYILLLLVVRHAQSLLTEQESQLEDANRELDQRVTERTAELLQSEMRFRSLTEMSIDFYWETDEWHRLTQHKTNLGDDNDRAFPQSSLIGQTCWKLTHCSPDEAGWLAHRAVLDAHLPFREFEFSRRDAHGAVRYFSISGDPRFDAVDQFIGYLGIGTEVTLRKRAEDDLRVAAAAFESREATVVTDASSVILRVNRAFAEITGYNADEVIGRTPKLLASGRHDADFYRDMWQSIHQTGGWTGEIWDRRKNGEVYPKWLNITAVKDSTGVISHYIGTHSDITDRKKAEEKIQNLAFFDSLTHLPNRTLLMDRLNQAIAVCRRGGTFGALLFIDLDHFKTLNDTLGHDKGDLLLQQVAQRLTGCVRQGDTVARLGGDEFVVVLKDLSEDSNEIVALTKSVGEKILAALNQTYRLGNVDHRSTASIGATVFGGNEIAIENLLKQADLAMYKSKDMGRNALRFFDPAMQSLLLERAELESGLRKALLTNEFELYYQPQVSINGNTTGAEALVRWHHPERGMISPADFIPLAEDTGLILPLGHWVLANACDRLARWAIQPELSNLTLAVNVSASQFRQADFVDQVLSVLARTGANPQRLKLELTESLFVDNMQDVIDKMSALKSKGVTFSLDDFGTGYSSLAYLSQLPLDQLKIDRSFVMGLESDDTAVVICAATISLAHALKLKVVAEGVETAAQRYVLSTVHRCDFIQGYLYSRPLPVEKFEMFAKTFHNRV